MVLNLRDTLVGAGCWLWRHIERFPIPIEDALWIIEAYGDPGVAEDILAHRDKRGSKFPDIWESPRHVSNYR